MKKNKNIMVCVTQQKTCERLINMGNEMKNDSDNLYIVNVVDENDKFLHTSNECEALNYLFNIADKVEAELTVIKTSDVIRAMVDFAKTKNVTDIIMGQSPGNKSEEHPIANKLKNYISSASYIII